MIRTFVDSGVLIYATRAEEPLAQKALDVLKDPERLFASSIFVKLEVLPKAIYNSQTEEIEFYEEFFRSVVYWATDTLARDSECLSPIKSVWLGGNGRFARSRRRLSWGDRICYK